MNTQTPESGKCKFVVKGMARSLSCIIGLLAHGLNFMTASPLFSSITLPETGKPANMVPMIFMVSFVAVFAGSILAFVELLKGRRLFALIGFLLCASSLFAGLVWYWFFSMLGVPR